MCEFGKKTGGGRRDFGRESTHLLAILTTVTKSWSAALVDISATGARLRSDEARTMGGELFLSVGRVKAFGTIRWRHDDECGVQFDEPLLQEDVIAIRRAARDCMGLDAATRAAMDDWVLGIAR